MKAGQLQFSNEQNSENKNKDLEGFFENDDTQTNGDLTNQDKRSELSPDGKLNNNLPGTKPLPLIRGKHSLNPDMKFGWKPNIDVAVPPVPLYFDFLKHPYEEFSA